jgi:hypothetical protein
MELVRYRTETAGIHPLNEPLGRVATGAAASVSLKVATDCMFRLRPFVNPSRNEVCRVLISGVALATLNVCRESLQIDHGCLPWRPLWSCRSFAALEKEDDGDHRENESLEHTGTLH